MTVAANVLSQTQGAVSQQVKRLEEMPDCPLFVRDRRTLRRTAVGARLHAHARRLLALNDEIWNDMAQAPSSGKVRLGVPFDLVGTVVAPVLRDYADRHPGIEIELVCAASSALLAALARGALDLAIVEEAGDRRPAPPCPSCRRSPSPCTCRRRRRRRSCAISSSTSATA